MFLAVREQKPVGVRHDYYPMGQGWMSVEFLKHSRRPILALNKYYLMSNRLLVPLMTFLVYNWHITAREGRKH